MTRAMGMVKKMIGVNLSMISLPVFINEPMTILQKTAEIGAFSDLLIDAAKETDPVRRMMRVASNVSACPWLIVGRTSKPFISLLGETFEQVTDKYRYYGECVEEKPPILAFVCEGEGFKTVKTVNATMHFNGVRVRVHDPNISNIELTTPDGSTETYSYQMTEMIVGNIMRPNARYMEPQGSLTLTSTSGCRAELKFHDRAWTSNYYTNRVECTVFDAAGTEKYVLEGYYTKEVIAKNLESGEEELVFKAP